MKSILRFYIFFFFVCFSLTVTAQNSPVFETPAKDTVIINSGNNFLVIPNISDGDSGEQELSFEVTSSDVSILTIDSVSYTTGNKLALVWVEEQSMLGTVTVTVEVADNDGTTTKDFDVVVAEYPHHGINFEIHDAIFWREFVPSGEPPVYHKIVQTTNMGTTYNSLNWSQIPLSVSAGCGNPTLCDGHDFGTGFLRGYLVPKVSGQYRFYMDASNNFALWLSTNSSFDNATVIAANSNDHGNVGTKVNGSRQSGVIPLDSGRVYAIYAAQWNVHHETDGVQWELPGEFGPEYIDGEYLYPEWDTQRPAEVDNVNVFPGDSLIRITWDNSNDNVSLKGYNIYVNGLKINSGIVVGNEYMAENIEPKTKYSISVTAVDLVDNESYISTIVNVETKEIDNSPPDPPTNLAIVEATGLAVDVSWSGASDGETGIFGYNLYLNGELYNTEGLIYGNTAVLQILSPDTEYDVEIEAIDAGLNVSDKSAVFVVSTGTFDPLGDNLGLKAGKLSFSTEAMSNTEGLGVNPDYKSGEVFNDAHAMLFEDLKPGAIRWGALTANPLSFSEYVGEGKDVTIGKFIALCNEFGAHTAFCCGVENSTDWRQNPETFIRFLEYINGPDSTQGGQLRVAEGYTEPFLENSPGIIFEFGNEVWGGSGLHNAQIGENYNEYAAWCREMATIMQESEYYDSTKIYLAYSSRRPSRELSYGLNEKIINGNDGILDWTAPSGYLGGNLDYDPEFPPTESELEYYENVRDRADSYLNGMLSSHKYEVQMTGRLMEQYLYESNTTRVSYNGRLGQALLSTDYYLTSMELASAIPTIFHLTGGEWRITEPENDYRRLPLFLTARYFNHLCKGDVLTNTYESNEMGISGTGAEATFSKRPVGIHTYRNDSGYTMVFISRDYVNDHYVQVDFPDDFSFNTAGKQYLLTGEDFSTKNTIVDTTDVTVEDGMIVKVPKHTMILIHFDAENIEMANLPLAYYPYPKIEEINISIIKGDDTFTQPLENKQFRATISPTDSWDKTVEWKLLLNSGNYNLTPLGNYCTITARSELVNETDSLILRASSRIGDVYDEFVLHVPKAVGINNIKTNKGFKIYPNPAQDKITVDLPENDILRIYSVSGTLVLEKEILKGKHDINIESLTEGVYTVRVDEKSQRLVITR